MKSCKISTGKSFRDRMIRTAIAMLRKKDEYTARHCIRVMKLAVGYAEHYRYPCEIVEVLKYASLLHDIGKMIIPRRILNKPVKLNKKELHKMQKHPFIGFVAVSKIICLQKPALIILQHHERIDGKGYPKALHGDSIHELSRILSVCDAFDAMTNNRIYKAKITNPEAVKELERNAGTQFDSEVVAYFSSYIMQKAVIL